MTDAEKSSWLLNEAASMQGTHIVRLRGRLEENVLREAFRRLQQRHFLLRSRVVDGNPPEFVEDPAEIPLTVKPWTENAWKTEAEQEVDDAIPWSVAPLARAVLLQSDECCDLLLSMHKAMHDGRSGVNALRDTVEFAAAIVENREPDLPALSGVYDISEPVRAKASLWRLVPFFANYLITILRMKPQSIAPETRVAMAKVRTGLHSCLFTPEETQSLLARCRANQTTVQGALSAAFLQAVAGELCDKQNKQKVAVDTTYTYDVRALLDQPLDDSMGTFVSATISFHWAGPSVNFWDLAREVRREIARNLSSGLVFTMIRIQTWMSGKAKSPEKLAAQVDKLRKPATFITNLGNFPFPTQIGPWVREHQTCLLSAKHFGACLSAVVMTVSGRLSINYFFAKPYLSAEHVESLAARVTRALQA
jgi:hypothetical protein